VIDSINVNMEEMRREDPGQEVEERIYATSIPKDDFYDN
jgi:hypothetical protein